jgi:hypothetical protein
MLPPLPSPAIMPSPRGKPCHWTCAMAWVDEHQDQDHDHEHEHEHDKAPRGKCPACKGGGLVPAPGCTCGGYAHTRTPMICSARGDTGRRRLETRRNNSGS